MTEPVKTVVYVLGDWERTASGDIAVIRRVEVEVVDLCVGEGWDD